MKSTQWVVIARSFVLVAMITVGVSQVMTQPTQDTIYTYYSNSSMTTVVGRLYDMCTGRWSTGSTSGYVDIELGYPCGSGPCTICKDPELLSEWGMCNDGFDNDDDGMADQYDPGCW